MKPYSVGFVDPDSVYGSGSRFKKEKWLTKKKKMKKYHVLLGQLEAYLCAWKSKYFFSTGNITLFGHQLGTLGLDS
jgi:hypothetical protein